MHTNLLEVSDIDSEGAFQVFLSSQPCNIALQPCLVAWPCPFQAAAPPAHPHARRTAARRLQGPWQSCRVHSVPLWVPLLRGTTAA